MLFVLFLGVAVAEPLVIAHRGAPAVLPDHTLEGYRRAIAMGADYIEPDLVPTRDGHLICRHENELGHTTDVAVKFPDRKTTKTVDGEAITGWFSEDFTLAEIKTLRATQPLDFRPSDHDGEYLVPTLDEVLALVQAEEARLGRRIGIYPETKHPSYFDALSLSLEEPLVTALAAAGYDGPDDPVFVQSFEAGNLTELRAMTKVRLIRLIDDAGDLLTPDGLRAIAGYADGVGVHKSHLIPEDATGTPNQVVEHAHAAGLLVHVYTFRPEARYLPPWAKGDALAELKAFYGIGVDGVFSDFAEQAVAARE